MTGEDDDDEVSPVTSPRYRHSNSMNKRREGSPSHEASLKDAEVLLSKTDPASSSSSCRPTSSPRTIPSSTPMTTNAQNLSVNPTTASLSHSTSAPTVISYVNNDNSGWCHLRLFVKLEWQNGSHLSLSPHLYISF